MFHPGFRNHYNYHDVAVMVMTENFILDRHINTICMPNQKDISEFISFDNCFATGWGKDKFGAKGDLFLLSQKKNGLHAKICILRHFSKGCQDKCEPHFFCMYCPFYWQIKNRSPC